MASVKAGSNRRGKNMRVSFSSDEELEMDEVIDNIENTESPEKSKENMEALSTMTEDEMAQHLKLCMKLSVENKINMKNAFGLHLIEIMQRIVKKNERADLQQASLSLQASSKIYAGRVDALYQDTFKFLGHLQSIVLGGKKDKKNKNLEEEMFDDNDDDSSEKAKNKPQKSKCKSFLKSEESLSIVQEVSAMSRKEPHGNFVTINSAFSSSRLASKLLSSLQLVDDSCQTRCAVPEHCFKPKKALQNVSFGVSPKLEVLLEKITKFNIENAQFQALLSSNEKSSVFNSATPKPAPPLPSFSGDGDDVFKVPMNNSASPCSDADGIDAAADRFDVLNISVDAFVNDIAAAVTKDGFNQTLLPPNSALKKMIDRSNRKSSKKPSEGKSTRKKVKEPFFAGRTTINKASFLKERSTTVSKKKLSEWTVENTTDIDSGYDFITEMERRMDEEPDYSATLDEVLDVIKQNDLHYHFKYYFNKMSQVWKLSRRKLNLDESFPGQNFGNQTEKRVGSLEGGDPINDPVSLALSFQNLSLNDSVHENSQDSADNIVDNEPAVFETEEQDLIDLPEPFETDIEKLMVTPPELVRPACMKYDKRPMNLNTEKMADLLWKIISKRLEVIDSSDDFVLFSEVYEELKSLLEKEVSEFISMQFAFVVLLILANQKTLLIENVKENTDLGIKQDISEIDVTDNI